MGRLRYWDRAIIVIASLALGLLSLFPPHTGVAIIRDGENIHIPIGHYFILKSLNPDEVCTEFKSRGIRLSNKPLSCARHVFTSNIDVTRFLIELLVGCWLASAIFLIVRIINPKPERTYDVKSPSAGKDPQVSDSLAARRFELNKMAFVVALFATVFVVVVTNKFSPEILYRATIHKRGIITEAIGVYLGILVWGVFVSYVLFRLTRRDTTIVRAFYITLVVTGTFNLLNVKLAPREGLTAISPMIVNPVFKAGDTNVNLNLIEYKLLQTLKGKTWLDGGPEGLASNTRNLNSDFVGVGSWEELSEELQQWFETTEFDELSLQERIEAHVQIFYSRRAWSEEAEEHMKNMTTLIWDSAYPWEAIDLSRIIGAPPEITFQHLAPPWVLSKWKKEALRQLKAEGVNPIFLGKQLDNYFEDAIDYELEAFAFRLRMKTSNLAYLIDVMTSMGGGVLDALSFPVAGLLRTAYLHELASNIDSVSNLLPRRTIESQYIVDSKGYVTYDKYDVPQTRLSFFR